MNDRLKEYLAHRRPDDAKCRLAERLADPAVRAVLRNFHAEVRKKKAK